MAAAVLMAAATPGAAWAQESAQRDCVVNDSSPALRASLGGAMTGNGDEASRDALFQQLSAVVDACVTRHGIGADHKGDYFDYSLARISREWLITDLKAANMSNAPVDQAMDFGPTGANPDLSADMTEDQIGTIVQAYIDSGVDIEAVDETVWEKVGAYAAATSIYWNKGKLLPF